MLTFTQVFLIVVVILPLGLAIAGRWRVDLAALIIALILGLAQWAGLGVLGPPNSPDALIMVISGFSRPVVITLIGLFIITQVLDKTGVTRWIARRILAIGGDSEARIVVLFTLAAASLSLFMNNVAVGALLLPSAIAITRRTKIKSSKLLMPIAFGTLLGGSATYFTTANIIVDSLLRSADPPQTGINILAFTPIGGLMAVCGIAYIGFFSKNFLPERLPLTEQLMQMPTGSELEEAYQLGERLWEARVKPGSKFVNGTLAQTEIGQRLGLSVVAIWHGRAAIFYPSAEQVIRENDILLIVGREDRVLQLSQVGLEIGREKTDMHISERGVSVVEIILSPHSKAEGQTLKQLNFRKRFGFTAVALWRDGRSYRTDVSEFALKRGDTFLLVGQLSNLKKLQSSGMFIALEPDVSDQPLQRRKAAIALTITAGAVIGSVLGLPVYFAMLIAAILMVLINLLTMEEAYRAVEWQVIFLIAAMYTVGIAMIETGLAQVISNTIIPFAQPFGMVGLAAVSFILSSLLTHIMGGQVTALVTAPIAISAAISLNLNPQAVAVATALGCSAAYLSPLAHPVNMLMMGPGNYKFNDYTRFGLPLMGISFVCLIIGLILFW